MAEVARGQHGVVGRGQLLQLGMSARGIEERLRRGRLHCLYRGVYAVGHMDLDQDSRWMAAVLASGAVALLSHRSAAQLWRIFPRYAITPEVTRPGYFRGLPGIAAHRSQVAADEREVVDGIPVASPFRTIFDLAAVVDRRALERAFHEAEVRGLRDRVSLPMLLERYPGRRGARSLRALLGSEEPLAITRNGFEEAFLALIDAHGLPRPRMNADLALRGRFFEIDALWERQRVALELDGRSVHGTRKRFESDRQRDRILVAEGWRTMRVTWRQLREEPEAVVGDLRLLLRQPGPHPHPHGR